MDLTRILDAVRNPDDFGLGALVAFFLYTTVLIGVWGCSPRHRDP